MSADLTAYDKTLRDVYAEMIVDFSRSLFPHFDFGPATHRPVPFTAEQIAENADYERRAKAAQRAIDDRVAALIASIEAEFGVETYLDPGSEMDASEGYVVAHRVPHSQRYERIP